METAHHFDRPTRDVILSMLKREPCTIRQIADYCKSNRYEIAKYLSDMSRKGLIQTSYINGQVIVSGNGTVIN